MASIGVEPIRPYGHRILSPARLPIPPRGRMLTLAMPVARHYRDRAMRGKPVRTSQTISRAALVGLVLLALIACAGCTTGGSKDAPGIANFGQVTPQVWRGSKPDREGMEWLAERGVKTIIDLQMEDESADVPAGVRYVPIRTSLWHCDQVDVAAVNRA